MSTVSDFDSYCRRIIAYSAALAAIGAVAILLITYRDDPGLFAGFCLGSIFSMLRWQLLIMELRRFARSPSGRTGHYMRSFFIRYGLTGAVIGVSLASAAFSPVTTIISVFLVNAVIIGEQVITGFRGGSKGNETWE